VKCVYCRARKGKRICPALGGLICSQCCGEYRVVRIACPSDCPYLDPNADYQRKRAGERYAQDRRDLYTELFELGGEKAAALFNLIEVVSFGYFQSRRDGQDAEVIEAVLSLRRKLSPLHIPAGPEPVFAERLKNEYESFAKQEPQRAADGQLATDVLDRALKFLNEISGGGLHSQRFLTGLIGYITSAHPEVADQLSRQVQEGGRIVVPGQYLGEHAAVHPHPSHQHYHHTGRR